MTVRCAALVLALGLALGHSSQGSDEESDYSGQSTTEEENAEDETTVTTEAFLANVNSTDTNGTSNQTEFLLMVAIPLGALLVLLFVFLIAAYFKSKRPKQEPSSQGSQNALQTHELGGETLKVPIFEEDTPSVMEIEMEELDKWMNSMNRNADFECLPTLKEEKEPNFSPSDNES
ncbi:transmembrane protein 154 [Arvicanthis niloticus]|uniref:transmembrane protein 154 n=1 Tax=Arvicanthis niloticus TaxID=61156 RepID=UPI001486F05D|nr:transmembrane protein 154 [Arvicanthis niloticus]